jgi:CRISPR/Cas system-associated exonuclease Cas4 (RecB family)
MSSHEMGFRPSHFPALTQCIHHENKEPTGDAAGRGTTIGERIAELITSKDDSIDYSKEEPPVQYACTWVMQSVMVGWRIVGVEVPVNILDGNGQEITHGSIDLLLERNREYQIVDWKTGDKNGYGPQLAAYMSAVMDAYTSSRNVTGTIVYLDLQETETVTLKSGQCFDLVQDLWEKWNNKDNEPHTINPYCSYCALRANCPAWRVQGALALDTVTELGIPTSSALVTAKVDALKNDPTKLEEFVLAWERAKTLVETDWKLKDALKSHMESGFKADHHILVHIKNSETVIRTVNAELFLEKIARHIGNMRAAPAIKVDPDKAVEVWKDYYGYGDDSKFPVDIEETHVTKPGYSYIRAKSRPGVGDARKRRKELE